MIRAEHLHFRYDPGSPPVLEDLSFRIDGGEYVSVVGDNGCGKSTLARLVLGLIRPTSGRIERNAKLTGYVPQKKDFLGMSFPLTVREMLDSYRAILKVRDRDAARRCLERVRMEGFADALVGTLSGGQAQRVLIARALVGKPDFIVLDEPSTGVDQKSQGEIYAIIRELNRKDGLTVMSVEHNLDAAIMNSTKIYHIQGGHGHFCDTESYAAERMRRLKEASNA